MNLDIENPLRVKSSIDIRKGVVQLKKRELDQLNAVIAKYGGIDSLLESLRDETVDKILDEAFKVIDEIFTPYLGHARTSDSGLTVEKFERFEKYVKNRTGVSLKFDKNGSGNSWYNAVSNSIVLDYAREDVLDKRKVLKDFVNGKIPNFLVTLAHELVHAIQDSNNSSVARSLSRLPFVNLVDDPTYVVVAQEAHANHTMPVKGSSDHIEGRLSSLNSAVKHAAYHGIDSATLYKYEERANYLVTRLVALSGLPVREVAAILAPIGAEKNNAELYFQRLEDEVEERFRMLAPRDRDEYISDLAYLRRLSHELDIIKLQFTVRSRIADCCLGQGVIDQAKDDAMRHRA